MGSEAPRTDAVAAQKPVIIYREFPDPTEADFDDDISEEEKKYYMNKFKDLNQIKAEKLHCTACDRHMGCAARNDGRMRSHPMLRTLVCRACHAFYNSGEFERGDDGSELYCRWCGQGGQVYCCSSCPIVFCAKCVKRNFSSAKIKEIESVDDWKCFKCVSGVLWDLRASCWALLRYCDLKNKLAYITEDPELKEKYQKACLVDDSECCKKKKTVTQGKKKDKSEEKKQEEKKQDEKKPDEKKPDDKKAIVLKRMPEIHIKKFAHQDACFNPIRINKRPGSPLYKKMTIASAPIQIAPAPPTPFIMSNPPMVTIPQQKKIKLANIESLKALPPPIITKAYTQRKIQKPRSSPMMNTTFNGFQTPSHFATLSNDTINLSLDSLTQGLDIAAVSAYNENPPQSDECMSMNEDDVVCTPDFPLEPLCEVTEDNNDDDVECITPGPLLVPRPMASMTGASTSVASTSTAKMPPPLVPRISQDDIVQMTDNDVTINKSTGGLKFRVDPQTLSANKMYRLPDGRVFAINANPNMPGGYSATIVAVAEATSGMRNMPPPSRVTYAAKLSTVIPAAPQPPPLRPSTRSLTSTTPKNVQTSTPKVKRAQKTKRKTATEKTVDLKTPVEWYRYNLVDATDLMSYVLKRINKLKANSETTDLRKKDVNEMKTMHKSFDQLLKTSITRFTEIRENLNEGFNDWSKAKIGKEAVSDDDVEILGDEAQSATGKANNTSADSDDPIFIDENSNDSVKITYDNTTNDNEAVNTQTIVISDRTDNINQDSVPMVREVGDTSRSYDDMSNDNEVVNSQTIVISDRTDNINQDTVPMVTEVGGTSRSYDDMSNDNEVVNSQTIVISDRTDNINQDTAPMAIEVGGTSRSYDDLSNDNEVVNSQTIVISDRTDKINQDTVLIASEVGGPSRTFDDTSNVNEVVNAQTVVISDRTKNTNQDTVPIVTVVGGRSRFSDDMPNDNEVVNAKIIGISDRTHNINQETVPIVTEVDGTSRSSDKQESQRVQEMETSSVPNPNGEEVTTNERMDTEAGKDEIMPSASNDAEVKDFLSVELVNDPNLASSNFTENTEVQVLSSSHIDPLKSKEDTNSATGTSSPVNSEITKNNSIPSSTIPNEARNDDIDSAISKDDSTDGEMGKGGTPETKTIRDDTTSSALDRFETSKENNKKITSSQTEVCSTLQESAMKVNGDNSEAIDISPQIKDNNQVDTTSDEDKNDISKLSVNKMVPQTAEVSSEISDNGEEKGVAEVDCVKTVEDKLSPTNSQGSEGSEINNSKKVNSDIIEDEESLGQIVKSISANANESTPKMDAVVGGVKLKAAQDLEMAGSEVSFDKMDMDLDLNEDELLNGDKTEKGDGERDDVAISDDLINDLLDDNLGQGDESKIPNLNIPCQP